MPRTYRVQGLGCDFGAFTSVIRGRLGVCRRYHIVRLVFMVFISLLLSIFGFVETPEDVPSGS